MYTGRTSRRSARHLTWVHLLPPLSPDRIHEGQGFKIHKDCIGQRGAGRATPRIWPKQGRKAKTRVWATLPHGQVIPLSQAVNHRSPEVLQTDTDIFKIPEHTFVKTSF